MHRIKSLVVIGLVALAPLAALASTIDDFPDDVNIVPEPTSALLMVAGFAAVVAVRRMRK